MDGHRRQADRPRRRAPASSGTTSRCGSPTTAPTSTWSTASTVNNLVQYTAMPPGSENRDLYLAILNQRFEKLRGGGIPLHVEDARDYHRLSARAQRRSSRRWSCTWPRSPTPGARTRTRCRTFGHSLRTLENSLDWARDSAEHFVYFSSSMVYGNFRKPEVTEEEPFEPIGIYGALKFAGEKIVIAYKQVFDLDYTIIRPSALYGPGCVSRRVSQIFIESALVGSNAARGRRRATSGSTSRTSTTSWTAIVRAIAAPGGAQRGLQHHGRAGALPGRPDRARPGALPRGRGGVRRARRAAALPRHAQHRQGAQADRLRARRRRSRRASTATSPGTAS